MEQSESIHSTIAAFNLDPFEIKINFIYGVFLPKYAFYTKIFDFNNNTLYFLIITTKF
jgi:hypothetical protein